MLHHPDELGHDPLSESALRAQYARPLRLQEHHAKLFGLDALAGLERAITHSDVADLDAMHALGALTKEELLDYLEALPQMHAFRREAFAAADAAAAHMVPRLLYYIDQSYDAVRRTFLPKQGIMRLLRTAVQLTEDFAAPNATVRGKLLMAFAERFASVLLTRAMFLAETNGRDMDALVFGLQDTLPMLPTGSSADYPLYRASGALVEWERYRRFLDTYGEDVRDLASAHPASADDIELLTAEVNDLSYLRLLESATAQEGDAHFRIYGDGLPKWEFYRVDSIAVADFAFDPALVAPDPTRPWHQLKVRPDRLRLDLSRTGELRFSNGGVPVSLLFELYGDPSAANGFTAMFLRRVRELLRARPEDRIPLRHEARRIADIEPPEPDDDGSMEPGALLDAEASDAPAPEAIQTETVSALDQLGVLPEVPPAPSRARISSRLRNLRESDVIAAFTRLLGAPTRITGSHHIFRGRSGATYPAPMHAGKTMGVGLLLRCLDHLGLDAEELLDALP